MVSGQILHVWGKFSVKTGQMPHLFPYIVWEGGSGA